MTENTEAAPQTGADTWQDGALLGRLEVIEAQPLEQRAERFDRLADELLAELQRGDQPTAAQDSDPSAARPRGGGAPA
ncbi:hypothetical protein J4H92_14115 [Leucobacter weissii]|uniref:Uncharacterized protein n=1 Tax=Leucobacter weissii TaxID=1983706 RepID=A0A939MQI2_9MICO|nr:hypothetical protein [Leucobacter weissii]